MLTFASFSAPGGASSPGGASIPGGADSFSVPVAASPSPDAAINAILNLVNRQFF